MADVRARLVDELSARIGTRPLTASEITAILSLAAAAAHGTGDRTSAPLASFLAGIAAASADDRGASSDEIRRLTEQLTQAPGTG